MDKLFKRKVLEYIAPNLKLRRQITILVCITILLFGTFGCDRVFGPPEYSVRRVSDGDTLALSDPNGEKISVRFACVDAPEIPHTNKEKKSRRLADRSQFKWGKKSQERLQELVSGAGNRVRLDITDKDRYGRSVAEVRLPDGTFVQEVLVSEGLAVVYPPYLKNCPSKIFVQQAQGGAKANQKGVWSDKRFIDPWEYRKQKKK